MCLVDLAAKQDDTGESIGGVGHGEDILYALAQSAVLPERRKHTLKRLHIATGEHREPVGATLLTICGENPQWSITRFRDPNRVIHGTLRIDQESTSQREDDHHGRGA
jgi:hypothetical protein